MIEDFVTPHMWAAQLTMVAWPCPRMTPCSKVVVSQTDLVNLKFYGDEERSYVPMARAISLSTSLILGIDRWSGSVIDSRSPFVHGFGYTSKFFCRSPWIV